MEEWKPAPGYEGLYEVSDQGRVRRTTSTHGRAAGYVLKPRLSTGYLTVTLSASSVQKVVKVHRLVALAFLGPAPSPAHEVCHADDVKTNNAASNLRWDTHQNNMRDMVRNGAAHLGPKEWCRRGLHRMTPENTYVFARGSRVCRACNLAKQSADRRLKHMREEGA